jgi:hypothetical protein
LALKGSRRGHLTNMHRSKLIEIAFSLAIASTALGVLASTPLDRYETPGRAPVMRPTPFRPPLIQFMTAKH